MNLLQKYSLTCGLKSKLPSIYEVYFPMPFKKYIYFEPFSNENGDRYKYWTQVIELLSPALESNNIKIIHCDPINFQEKKEISEKCVNISGQIINRNQAAYLIKKSICYLGTPSFAFNVASFFNKKIVCLYGNASPKNIPAPFSSKDNVYCLEPQTKLKPFYISPDLFQRINLIKPEEIAQSVLNALGIDLKINFSTLHIGNNFENKTLEIIPEDGVEKCSININNPIIRMDYKFNENILSLLLTKYNSSIIFTDREISEELLLRHRSSISRLIYIIKKDNNPNFIKLVNNIGIKADLISYLDKESIQKIKINYMDFGAIKLIEKHKKPVLPDSKTYGYISSRIIFGKDGQFKTKYDWTFNSPSTDISNVSQDFWDEDSENLYIYCVDTK